MTDRVELVELAPQRVAVVKGRVETREIPRILRRCIPDRAGVGGAASPFARYPGHPPLTLGPPLRKDLTCPGPVGPSACIS